MFQEFEIKLIIVVNLNSMHFRQLDDIIELVLLYLTQQHKNHNFIEANVIFI